MSQDYAAVLAELKARIPRWQGPISMLSFTLAGIQEFIGSARSTRDVWNGSFMLSLMASDACRAMLSRAAGIVGCQKENLDRAVLIPDVPTQPLIRHSRGDEFNPRDLAVASFPNTILMLVPGPSTDGDGVRRDHARLIAEAGISGLHDAWRRAVSTCRAPIQRHFGPFASEEFEYQSEPARLFEPYWSAVDLPETPEDLKLVAKEYDITIGESGSTTYGALMRWSSRTLAARKTVRDIEQMGQAGLRCSLCGARSALANYAIRPRNPRREGDRIVITVGAVKALWDAIRASNEIPPFAFRPGEYLCAVCAIRRLAPHFALAGRGFPAVDFPSTSTLATAGGIAGLVEHQAEVKGLREVVEGFATELRRGLTAVGRATHAPGLPFLEERSNTNAVARALAGLDGDFYYEDTYQPSQLAEHLAVDESVAEQVFQTSPLSTFKKRVATLHLPDGRRCRFLPSNYFATIAVDGDKMGDWISGATAGDFFGPDWQSDLSSRLAAFSRLVRHRLEDEMPGRVVYAGGDDLLAFVPREYALAAMDTIDDTWRRTVVEPAESDLPPRPRIEITVSMACVLAKHNQPLSWVIAESHRLLKEYAKSYCGRNAFAIARTTGGAVTVGAPIRLRIPAGDDSANELFDSFAGIAADMTALVSNTGPGLSARIVNDVYALDAGMASWDGQDPSDARRVLLERLVRRHWSDGGQSEGAHASAKRVLALHDAVAAWVSQRGAAGVDVGSAWARTADLLAMLRFLSREGR